jgi:flagellar biosynthetic protein FlhB
MADEFDQSKTEAPTLRRREEAREQGHVAFSSELAAGLLLLAGVLALWYGAHTLTEDMMLSLRLTILTLASPGEFGFEQSRAFIVALVGRGMESLGVFWGLLFLVGLGVGAMQVGFHFLPDLLGPRWEKLSPAQGWKRIFSFAAVMRGVMALVKVAAIIALAAWILRGRTTQIMTFGDGQLSTAAVQGWNIAIRLALACAAGLVLVGVADYAFQRWRYEQALRMTRQELKEEVKREEGDPQMRARLRKMQREMSRKRMMQDVPRSTVVITNPTHLAVALRYERGRMAAPRVVAKGAGFVAMRIVELARRHAVPVVERKPIAQALFKAVKVGQEIPAALYYTVAEILAYVYRLRHAV